MNKITRCLTKLKRILKSSGGFSFTELLVATLIMLLATGALTATINLAIRHFFLATQRSEAQFLCASLAEFVEDELSFAEITVSGNEVSWSKGTHNMGSDIGFFVQSGGEGGAAPSYQKVGSDTIGNYGKLVITGSNYKDNWFNLVSDGAYDVEKRRGYSLLAGMSLKWEDDRCKVMIRTVDKKSRRTLSETELTVKPVLSSP